VTVRDHIYPVPDAEELARMVGAATPHFALQIRDRVLAYAAALPADDPRRDELSEHVRRLDALATGGEAGSAGQAELPARPSLDLASSAGEGVAQHG
jgi:hypothetical protein